MENSEKYIEHSFYFFVNTEELKNKEFIPQSETFRFFCLEETKMVTIKFKEEIDYKEHHYLKIPLFLGLSLMGYKNPISIIQKGIEKIPGLKEKIVEVVKEIIPITKDEFIFLKEEKEDDSIFIC